jgi:E3 ubiquitin-protein ligase UBR7
MGAKKPVKTEAEKSSALPAIAEESTAETTQTAENPEEPMEEDPPPPPGFPTDDEFEGFICYQCVDAFPWIKRYAGTPGFLPAVFVHSGEAVPESTDKATIGDEPSRKRKADDGEEVAQETKRSKADDTAMMADAAPSAADVDTEEAPSDAAPMCKLTALPPAPEGRFSLFFAEGFREKICRCASCFPLLLPHPQLLEEEETYEPPVSEEGSENGGSTHGSGSLLDRGESALRNVDRVRAIEGVMAYNHLKDRLKPFFQQFAESGQAISAEDIKEYFAKLRGDEQAIKEAGEAAKSDSRQEQSGY